MRWGLIVALLIAASAARAEEKLAADLREQIVKVPFELADVSQHAETHDLVLTIFRPQGPGPFPIVVLSHGRSPDPKQRKLARFRMEPQARYFVRKGFMVVVPTRVGYGPWATGFDPEAGLDCGRPDYAHQLQISGGQIIAALTYARSLPDGDARRAIVAGVSVGGIASVAAAATNPPGLLAAINFSGGAGGNPKEHPGRPCAEDQLDLAYRLLGRAGRVPELWLYARNDKFFDEDHAARWARLYREKGAPLQFEMLPAIGDDGHVLFNQLEAWTPITEQFLAGRGFTTAGTAPPAAATHFADLRDVSRVPRVGPGGREAYQKFLQTKSPRAFAIGSHGGTGWAFGPGAADTALDFCRAHDSDCALYAVDENVVWQERAAAVVPAPSERASKLPVTASPSAASKDALRDQIRASFQQGSGN